MAQDSQHSEVDTPTHNTDTEWTSEEEMESMEKQYREFVLKRTGRTASQQTEQRDIWEGCHTEDVKAHRRKLLKDVMKCGKAKRDVKIAEIARVDSYLLAQTDRERLWNEEKFERERQEKLSLMEQVKNLHALVREKESALNAPVKHPDADTQNTYGSNNLPHSEPRGRSPGPDPTMSMATVQSNFDEVTPSQIEEREEEIIIQTGKHEADHPNVRERQIINPKSSGYTVMIGRKRAELVQDGKHDLNSTPGRRTSHKHDQHDTGNRSSPERRTSHKHEPWDKQKSPSQVDPRYRCKRHYKSYVKQSHRGGDGSSDTDSSDDDQHDTDNRHSSPERRTSRKHYQRDMGNRHSSPERRTSRKHYQRDMGNRHSSPERRTSRKHYQRDMGNRHSSPERRTSRKHYQRDKGNRESSPEGRMTRKYHPRKITRTTDERDRNPDNHEARDKHKYNTSPSRHHTRSRQHEGQGQKHSPHRHRSRRPRTPTHKHESQDPRKENKRHKQRDRYESSDRGRSRHRHGKHDNSDSRDKGSSREHSSGTDTTDDEQHTFNSKTLKLMDKALVRIPYFDPHNKNRDIHTYIATVEQEAKIRGLGKSAEKACLLSRSLHEPARPWVASLPNRVKSDFKQLSRAVVKRFGEYSTLSEGLNAAKLMTQRVDEDPRDYLLRLKKAYYAGDGDNAQGDKTVLKVMFFQSLRPEIVRIVGMMLDPETASLRQIESKAHTAWVNGRKTTSIAKTHIVTRDKECLDLEGSESPRNNISATRGGHEFPQERAPNPIESTPVHNTLNSVPRGGRNEARRTWHSQPPPPWNAEEGGGWNYGGGKASDGPYLPRGGRRPPNQSPYRPLLPPPLTIEHRPPLANRNRYAHHIRMEKELLGSMKTPMQIAKGRTPTIPTQEEDTPSAKVAQVNVGKTRSPEAITEVVPEGKGYHLGELIPVGPVGRVHVEVILQDTLTSQGLCDTGAEISMISRELFDELQTALQRKNETLQMMPSNLTYSGCEGTHMRPLGKVMTKLTFNKINMNHPLYVVRNPGKELIIGIKLMNRLKPIMNLESRQIWAQSMPEQQRDSEDEDVMRDSTGIQVITQ
ncbi:uncharacterized protein LOC144731191 [Lampetra planeri]